MNDTIKITAANSEVFDKKQIAIAIRNSTLSDALTCSLKEDMIIIACENCSLKVICNEIDKLSEKYTLKTSTVIKNYSFL